MSDPDPVTLRVTPLRRNSLNQRRHHHAAVNVAVMQTAIGVTACANDRSTANSDAHDAAICSRCIGARDSVSSRIPASRSVRTVSVRFGANFIRVSTADDKRQAAPKERGHAEQNTQSKSSHKSKAAAALWLNIATAAAWNGKPFRFA